MKKRRHDKTVKSTGLSMSALRFHEYTISAVVVSTTAGTKFSSLLSLLSSLNFEQNLLVPAAFALWVKTINPGLLLL
jgi:hypothetical protein